MRKILATLLLLCSTAMWSMGKDGYKIDITFKNNITDSTVYLAHYFGKALPTIFKIDSAKVVKGKAVFENKNEIIGGVYLLIYGNNTRVQEFLLENGNSFGITIQYQANSLSDIAHTQFTNSPANDRYLKYNRMMEQDAEKSKEYMVALTQAKNHTDSVNIAAKHFELQKQQKDFRKQYTTQYPNTLLSAIFSAMQMPEVPVGDHYLADGKTKDTLYPYYYYKEHYWDGFNFKDDRLVYTPIYDAKLNNYFNNWVMPIPDSVKYEADKLLKATAQTKELFRYTLRTLTNNSLQSKIMGIDEVFVYLVEQYYMKGAAYWLSEKDIDWYQKRAQKIAPNVLGNIAPDLLMQDIFTMQDKALHSIKSKYTVLVIWSYDCGTCQKEIPALLEAYNKDLKNKGVTVYSIASGGDLKEIQKFINNNKINSWINVGDINNNTGYKDKYDAYSTPKLYLLDENKHIIGKGLDHTNIATVIERYELKNASK
jgi:thiol-disulfide isomerase/thioredoxin